MAACLLADIDIDQRERRSTCDSIYRHQINDRMESTNIERNKTDESNDESPRFPFDFNLNRNRKRKLSSTDSCNILSSTAATNETHHSNSPRRPTSLFLSSPTSDFRKSVSHPSTTSPCPFREEMPLKFASLTEFSLPATKRLRPLTLVPTTTTTTSTSTTTPLPRLISPSELAEQIKTERSLMIFDCGSPIRHSENRINKSILLPVANKISRKLFLTDDPRDFPINVKQMNESSSIILYDDQNHSAIRSTCDSTAPLTLSSSLKFASDEIRRCLTNSTTKLFLLSCSFDQFFDVYPNLCESLRARSCPSSPIDSTDEQRFAPQTAPPIDLPRDRNDDENLQTHPMTHIIDGLFIGSESNAKNLDELTSEDIRNIVNVTSHVPLYHRDHLEYCHLPADDSQKQNLLDYFDQAYAFIHKAIEKNEKVLVHCVAGISRSPAIVIGFLMRYAKMTMNDAYNFVKRKRTIVSPNLNFMGQLLEYEKKLKT